jgi:hypothetical protein
MKLLLEYFGLLVFCFVLLVGGMIALPETTSLPATSLGEMVGLGLAFIVIGGGFTWYYLARSHQGDTTGTSRGRTTGVA